MKNTYLVIAIAALVAACGNKEVSFDTVETNRTTAKVNAEYNAMTHRSSAPQFANYAVEVQGDSTQSPKCPQGDGWASAKLVDKSNPAVVVRLKCSTVSGAIGCMTQADFQTKPYASDDGQCQDANKVPFPLPKIAK